MEFTKLDSDVNMDKYKWELSSFSFCPTYGKIQASLSQKWRGTLRLRSGGQVHSSVNRPVLLILTKGRKFLSLGDPGANRLFEQTETFFGKSWQWEVHLCLYL